MRILNNINIDLNTNNETVFELTVKCNSAAEVMDVFRATEDASNLVVDSFESNDVTIITEAWRFSTEQDFIKSVRKLLK